MKVISIASVRSEVEGQEVLDDYEASVTVPPPPAGQPLAFVTQSAVMNLLNSQLSGLAQAEIIPTSITIRLE